MMKRRAVQRETEGAQPRPKGHDKILQGVGPVKEGGSGTVIVGHCADGAVKGTTVVVQVPATSAATMRGQCERVEC